MTVEWWTLGLLLAALVGTAALWLWRARRQPLALQVVPEFGAGDLPGPAVVLQDSDLAVEVSVVGRASVLALLNSEPLDDTWWVAVSESAVLQVWSLYLPTDHPGDVSVRVRAVSGRRRAEVPVAYRVVPPAARGGTVEFTEQVDGGVRLTFWGVTEQEGEYLLGLEFQPTSGRIVHVSHRAFFGSGETEYRFPVERAALEKDGAQGPFRLLAATLQPGGAPVPPTPLDLEPWPEDAEL